MNRPKPELAAPMIRYTLRCPSDHGFESWFQSAASFDALASAGHLSCPVCGSAEVIKGLMAPSVAPARRAADRASGRATDDAPNSDGAPSRLPALAGQENGQGLLSVPGNRMEAALAALRKEVEAHSEYVGPRFATEARAMHDGLTPERAVHGEARPEEVRQLLQEGVPILPLPFRPTRKTN